MVKLQDIATKLGLSLSVVSRAMSDNPDKHSVVREATRERIRAYAAQVGYQPNRQASFLGKRGKSANIFCYLPDYPTRLINDLLFGISETACAENFPVNFIFGKHNHDLSRFIEYAKVNPHAGILTYPTAMMAPEQVNSFKEYHQTGGKILFLNTISNTGLTGEPVEFQGIPTLNIDENKGGKLAAAHLLSLKPDVVYLLTLNLGYIYDTRELGFTEYCHNHGHEVIRITPEEIQQMNFTKGMSCAIFADCDYVASDLYSVLARKGLSVGKEILLCGFDDIFYGRIASPSLTTIHQPMRHEGRIAVQKLVRMIYGIQEKDELLSPYLLHRESTGGTRPDPEHPELEKKFTELP